MDVNELEKLLKDAGLEHYLEKASAWCIDEGARFIYEIDENINEFSDALALKRLEKSRLEKALVRAVADGSPTAKPPPAPPGPQPSLPPRPTSGGLSEHVRVKNTFLDLDDRQRSDLPRSVTAPAGGGAREDSDAEEEEEPDVDQPGSPRGVADLAHYKTMTVVDYESVASWGWVDGGGEVQGDPNAPAAGVVAAPSAAVQGAVYVPVGFVPVDPFIRWADEDPTPAPPAPDPAPAPQRDAIIQRTFSCSSLVYRIRWTVDSRKLKSADREAASPIFELSFAGPVEFRMILKPRAVHDAKGGASFKKAQGWGSVELKCLGDVDVATNPVVTFRLGVGSASNPKKQQRYRGPMRHDFRERPICGLEGRDEWWDFQRSVDKQTQSFVVCLEVFPSSV